MVTERGPNTIKEGFVGDTKVEQEELSRGSP